MHSLLGRGGQEGKLQDNSSGYLQRHRTEMLGEVQEWVVFRDK